jgi:type VI secretion system protein ImpC
MADTNTAVAQPVTLDSFMKSVRIEKADNIKPLIKPELETSEDTSNEAQRFASSVAAMIFNLDQHNKFDKQSIRELIQKIDALIAAQVNEVLHHKSFQELESAWRAIADLDANVNYAANIDVNLLDVSKGELATEFELNGADVAGTELFKKIYVAEYDQFGGLPYGAMVGLYDFENSSDDISWLSKMGKVARASHAPFFASVSPKFFKCDTFAEVNQLRDIAGMMAHPRYGEWNKLRDSDEAGYLGLVMPRYLVRKPWKQDAGRNRLQFEESIDNPTDGVKADPLDQDQKADDYLWGSAAMLLARNLARSFEESRWCQYIRGVRSGGLLSGLPTHSYLLRGEDLLRAPTEVSMPDYRELELANAGLIPLIHRKGTADAVFFSVQSLKSAKEFADPKDSENSQLTTNLSYTFSISRIAHYIKCLMRDNIGSSANASYIREQINAWISRYVTTIVNPDDLTLRHFPFKAYSLDVTEVEGRVGWYQCNLSVLPHIQFEGMNVDLRVDARLASK